MAANIDGNSDLLGVILVRLPISSLLRFKLVSKSWLTLISSVHFCKTWTKFHVPSPSGIFLRSNTTATDFHYVYLKFLRDEPIPNDFRSPFQSLRLPQNLVIHGSCHGLLLCHNEGLERTVYCVFNPTTNQYKEILNSERICKHDGFTLVFDPHRSIDYRVFWLRYRECDILIYSSASDTWTKSTVDNYKHPKGYEHGVYYEEGIYCLDCESFSYLDLSTLKYLPLQFPFDPYDQPQSIEYFGVSFGHLHCVTVDREEKFLYVYELMGREDLVQTHRVDISGMYPRFVKSRCDPPPRYPKFTIIAVLCRGEGIDHPYVVFHAYGKVMRLDVGSGRVEDLKFDKNDLHPLRTCLFQRYSTGDVTVDSFFYYESLAPVCNQPPKDGRI